MNFSILLFSFECGASNAANLNIVAFFISVLQLFPYKKYIYTSIEYFLRFFVSYLTIYIYIYFERYKNYFDYIFLSSHDSTQRFQTKMCEQLWCQVNETTCMSNGAQSADGTKCGEKKVRLSPSILLTLIYTFNSFFSFSKNLPFLDYKYFCNLYFFI